LIVENHKTLETAKPFSSSVAARYSTIQEIHQAVEEVRTNISVLDIQMNRYTIDITNQILVNIFTIIICYIPK